MAGLRQKRSKNLKGSSQRHRARKQWLLDVYGDGKTVECHFNCGTILDFNSLTVDRYPIPGALGGRYNKGNIRPACYSCNCNHGKQLKKEGVRYRWED